MPDEKNGEQPSSKLAQVIGATRSNRAENLRAKAELVKARAEAKAMKRSSKRGDSESTTTPQAEKGERRAQTSAEYARQVRQLASGSESEIGSAQKAVNMAKEMKRPDTPLATSPEAVERKDISEFLRKRVGLKK